MQYRFEKDGKTVAVLTMPDDIECFSILGDIMSKVDAPYVTLEKEKPLTEDEERSKSIWNMVNEMEEG